MLISILVFLNLSTVRVFDSFWNLTYFDTLLKPPQPITGLFCLIWESYAIWKRIMLSENHCWESHILWHQFIHLHFYQIYWNTSNKKKQLTWVYRVYSIIWTQYSYVNSIDSKHQKPDTDDVFFFTATENLRAPGWIFRNVKSVNDMLRTK